MEIHWKIQLLSKSSWKTNIEGEDCLKRVLELFADLRGAYWQETGGGVFEGGWDPNADYAIAIQTINNVKVFCSVGFYGKNQ